MTPETQNRIETLSALGFRLECGAPSGEVEKGEQGDWPHIAYTITLFHHNKRILSTDYRLGIGHVKPEECKLSFMVQRQFTANEESFLEAWKRNPRTNFKDKELQASVAAKLAKLQKVAPNLAEVLNSLLSDGTAFFNGETFEEWAGNYGYDTDSRKAEAIFKACDLIGRQLNKISREILDKAREATQDM